MYQDFYINMTKKVFFLIFLVSAFLRSRFIFSYIIEDCFDFEKGGGEINN